MKKILEEYGSVIVGVVGAIIIIGIIAASFMNDGLIAHYLNTMFNNAY